MSANIAIINASTVLKDADDLAFHRSGLAKTGDPGFCAGVPAPPQR